MKFLFQSSYVLLDLFAFARKRNKQIHSKNRKFNESKENCDVKDAQEKIYNEKQTKQKITRTEFSFKKF